MKTYKGYKIGDKLEIIYNMRKGEIKYIAKVIEVNWKGNGHITYSGTEIGSGSFNPDNFGKGKFGLVSVKII